MMMPDELEEMHKKYDKPQGTILITMEEYKELLMIKGRYEELKEQPAKPILYREPTTIKEYGNNPFRETLTTDPLPKETYKVT